MAAAATLKGRYRIDEALARITSGLPVTVRRLPGGFVVTPSPALPPAPSRRSEPPAQTALPASSPSTPAPPALPIVVTGYRESLRGSVGAKHAARALLEVTRAEDIAAFPDRNAADALQRLPGVAISRDNGEGRQISLRGLGPLFTRTTLNGMETLATTASGMDNRGSASRNRRFDYSVFDAGLFSAVSVRKTWLSDEDAGGIGGTVALTTLHPFDRSGDITLASGKLRSRGNGKGLDPQLTGEFARRGGEWGLLIAGSWGRSEVSEYGYRNWDWVPVTFGTDNIGPGVSEDDAARLRGTGDPVYMSRAQSYSTWTNRSERANIVGSLEYRGDDGRHLTLDLVHARLSNHRREFSIAAAGTNGLTDDTVDGTQVLNAVTIVGDTIVAADFSGIDMRTEAKQTEDHTEFDQAVFALEWPLGDATRLEARAGVSRSDFEEPVFDKVFLESTIRDFAYVATGKHPANTYGFDITDPANWSLMRADTREDSIVNSYAGARVSVIRNVAPGLELRFGANYRRYVNDGYERRFTATYDTQTQGALAVPLLFEGASLASYIVADVDATFAATGQERALSAAYDQPGSAYRIRENSYAGFALAHFEGALGLLPVAGELGVQYVRLDTSSQGDAANDADTDTLASVLLARAQTSRFTAWLPSLQLRADLAPDVRLRLAASRNFSRPDVADLRAAAAIDSTPFGGTIETGNPSLEPMRATALDLAIERYWGREGFASVALFYKKIDSFITTQTRVMTYAETGFPAGFLYPGVDASAQYNVVRPVNVSGAGITGAEIAVQRDLAFLPAPLDRLGIQSNVTYAEGSSKVFYDENAVRLPLVDLSRWSGNATLYYAARRWDARLSAAYRGAYRTGAGKNGNIGTWVKSSLTLDFAAHARLGKAMQMVFEASNLTDAPIVEYTDRDAKRLLARTRSGRVVSTGLRCSF
nr:TonB-dependent receptor [Novosphingobium profundi]